MRRIILSIILGFVFPIICIILIEAISEHIPTWLTVSTFYGQPAPGILLAPFTIPFYFDNFVKAERILPQVFDTFWFRVLTFVFYNWIVYGILGYLALGRLKRLKKRSVSASENPPPPPAF